MKRVEPFTALRYADKVSANIIDLLAPPYDVISTKLQDKLYDRHPNNVVRLILGRIYETDNETENRYSRSAKDLADWKEAGIVKRDEKPAIYLYAQDFSVGGTRRRRTGFICRRLVEDFGTSIFPHEATLAGPKIDRLNLTRACDTNFSQVFSLYSDKQKVLDTIWEKIMATPADISVTDDENEDHHLWVVTDEKIIATVQDFLEDKPLVIADGHHRYTTAINFRDERRKEAGHDNPLGSDYCMMFIANVDGDGFTVLPTHRMVTDLPSVDLESFKNQMSNWFDLEERDVNRSNVSEFADEVVNAGAQCTCFGIYTGNGKGLLAKFTGVKKLIGDQKFSDAEKKLKLLDVSILQEVIITGILGVSKEAVAAKKNVAYTIDLEKLINDVDKGSANLGFILDATPIDDVLQVAMGGFVMPQKSTYFYPKLISGMVMNPIDLK